MQIGPPLSTCHTQRLRWIYPSASCAGPAKSNDANSPVSTFSSQIPSPIAGVG